MYCGICGKEIPDDSVFCLYCGTTAVKKAGEVPVQPAATLKDDLCPVCGCKLDRGDSVCPKCDFPVISLLHGTDEEIRQVSGLIEQARKEYVEKENAKRTAEEKARLEKEAAIKAAEEAEQAAKAAAEKIAAA